MCFSAGITLFFAVLLNGIPFKAQQVASKFLSFGSGDGQLRTSLGIAIGVDSVWAAVTNDNWIHESLPGALVYVADTANENSQVLCKDGIFVFQSDVADIDDDQWNSLSVEQGQPALFRIEHFQLPAFTSLQVVDQVCSYRFILY